MIPITGETVCRVFVIRVVYLHTVFPVSKVLDGHGQSKLTVQEVQLKQNKIKQLNTPLRAVSP